MALVLLVASMLCGLIAASDAFGWFGIQANYNGFLAMSIVLIAAAMLPWPPYFRR